MTPFSLRSPTLQMGVLTALSLLLGPIAFAGEEHDPAKHLAACKKPMAGRPFSDQDEKIHRVIALSRGDEENALREMAKRYGVSVKEARQAFARVEQAEKDNWQFKMMDAFHETVACLARQHGLELIQPAAPAGTHLYVFVDSPTSTPNPMDVVAEDMLGLKDVETVTVQFHVKGAAKIRRDYPIIRKH